MGHTESSRKRVFSEEKQNGVTSRAATSETRANDFRRKQGRQVKKSTPLYHLNLFVLEKEKPRQIN